MDRYEILKDYFGYSSLKPEQEKIIDEVLKGNDVIGLLPTGYGKSLTFQIPALLFSSITVVICPLISLMQDQVRGLNERLIPACYINSLQDYEEQKNVYNKIYRGRVKIVYVSAERLLTKDFIELSQRVKIDFIVSDEAHTLLWGEDFRFSLARIKEFLNRLDNRPPILALTATATNDTVEKIKEMLGLKNPRIIIGNPDRKNIFYNIIKVRDKDSAIYLRLKDFKDKAIIYTLTIKNSKHVYDFLKDNGINSEIYHGRLSANEKKRIQEDFTKGKVKIIICTNAFGMGIDIPDIRLVIEYDLPSSIEDFSQQTGRASRDGKPAEAIMLFNLEDIKINEYFISNIEYNGRDNKTIKKIKNDRLNKLDMMVKMCLSHTCIHKYISNYFGIKHDGHCNMCSNCVRRDKRKR